MRLCRKQSQKENNTILEENQNDEKNLVFFFFPPKRIHMHEQRCVGSPDGSVVKNLLASAGDAGSIPGLGRSPGERMATHSSILPWKSHGQRSLAGYSPQDCKRVRQDLTTKYKQYGCVGSHCIYFKKKDEIISKSILMILNIKPKSKHFVFTVNMRIAISLYVFKFYLQFS